MEEKKLEAKINQYKETLREIRRKQDEWQNSKKGLIKSALQNIVTRWELSESYFVDINDSVLNHESVQLVCKKTPTWFDKDTNQPIMKECGILLFGQLRNGRIAVVFMYPQIQEFWTNNDPSVLLGEHDPKDINNQLVIEYVTRFFDELIKSESNDSYKNINF